MTRWSKSKRIRRIATKSKTLRRTKTAVLNIPRTAEQFFAMPKRRQQMWTKATNVVSKMRRTGVSLQRASQEAGIGPWVVRRFAGRALRKRQNGRYAARRSDKLLRVLVIPRAQQGLVEIATTDSRQASKLSKYWSAVSRYITKGNSYSLKEFDNQFITDINGKKVRLLTNLDDLDLFASAGVLSFETMYAQR